MLGDSNSNSIRVDPGIGTGADSKRNIHVSISLTSCSTIDGVWSIDCPVIIVHTLSLLKGKKTINVNYVRQATDKVIGNKYIALREEDIRMKSSHETITFLLITLSAARLCCGREREIFVLVV